MLDIEIVEDATDKGINVVTVAELGRHMRLSPSLIASAQWTGLLTDAINDAVAKLDGFGSEINRTVLPRTYKRYMSRFPGKDECGNPKPILLPYPPVIDVLAITVEDGSSPANVLSSASYVVKSGMLVPEIHPKGSWPSVSAGPRAVSVTYQAGYVEYPAVIKRYVKFLAAHYVENTEATVLEQNKTLIDRRVLFAIDDLRASLRIPVAYDDWNE